MVVMAGRGNGRWANQFRYEKETKHELEPEGYDDGSARCNTANSGRSGDARHIVFPYTPPTVMATANPGELLITWDAVPDAQHFTVGYANLDDLNQMTEAGEERLRRVLLRHHRCRTHRTHPQWLGTWN